jgi:hypothetical protein
MYDVYESIHNDDLGPVVGNLRCGVDGLPVRSWSPQDGRNRENDRLASDLKMRQLLNEPDKNTAEVMPGEVICPDNIVRRETAAEKQFNIAPSVEQAQGVRVTVEEAKGLSDQGACIIWRPNGIIGESEYALLMNQISEGD